MPLPCACAGRTSGGSSTPDEPPRGGLSIAAPDGYLWGVSNFYSFTAKDIDGTEKSLGDYTGKVVLVVNVASKCGFTPQYKGLETLYNKYKQRGFVILGFPADNFGHQEPGSDAEIKTFCSTTYGVTFPLFSKISVKGDDIHPLYAFLTNKETNPSFPGKIGWNFTKFLVDRSGKVIDRWESKVEPMGDTIPKVVEKALDR